MIIDHWLSTQGGELINVDHIIRLEWNGAGDEVMVHITGRTIPLYYGGAVAARLSRYFNRLESDVIEMQSQKILSRFSTEDDL